MPKTMTETTVTMEAINPFLRPLPKWAVLLSILFTLGGTSHSVCLAQSFMTESGYAEFNSSVPLHSFQGTSEHLTGRIDLADFTMDFYLDLETLKTGINKRDKDMRTTLETDQYPFAEFFGKLVTPFDPETSTEQPARVKGEFSIHGVTQEVEIEGTLKKTEEGLLVEAGWILRLEDYNIEPPGILFYRVDQEQKIKIRALLISEEDQ